MTLVRPSDLARLALSFANTDQGKQMVEQWIPGIFGSSLSKKDEAIFDTLHILLKEIPGDGERLYEAIKELFNDVLEKHQRVQFRISIISLPLPTTKKESWGGEKKDKHSTYDVREELNANDQRVKNLSVWARIFLTDGREKTLEQLIKKNMISEHSLIEQFRWVIRKVKELGTPAWEAVTETTKWSVRTNERIKKTDKWFFWPLAVFIIILLVITIHSL